MNGKNQHLVIKKTGHSPVFLLPGYINSVFTSGGRKNINLLKFLCKTLGF